MKYEHPPVENPGVPSAFAVGTLRRIRRLVGVLFRPSLRGQEHLPTDRPFLLVANHSAGLGLAELLCFAVLYVEQVGEGRPLAGFAHPIGFRFWPLKALHPHLGAVPSTYAAAYDALDRGVPLLVFPGGDYETLRPIWQANLVDFGGRKGFLRIAKKSGVPIIPMGIRGSHFTAPILLRAKWLAWVLVLPKLLGLKRWGISLLALLCSVGVLFLPLSPVWKALLVWLCLTSPLMFLPIIPWRIRYEIGPVIEPEELFPEGLEEDEALVHGSGLVIGRIQDLVSK